MSTATRERPSPATAMPPEPACPLTVEQYYAMLAAGIIDEDADTELLEGWVLPKMTRKPPHDVCVDLLHDVFPPILPAGWFLRTQGSARLRDSVPEPDGAILRGRKRDYLAGHPEPKNIGVIMEVAETSLRRDRGLKKRVYARAKIPTYWIINLVDEVVEVYTNPTGRTRNPTYRTRQVYEAPESIPLVLNEKAIAEIAVKDLLP